MFCSEWKSIGGRKIRKKIDIIVKENIKKKSIKRRKIYENTNENVREREIG